MGQVKAYLNSKNTLLKLSQSFIMYMLVAHLGWGLEVVFMYIEYGKFYDRGFMTLPFCPIYSSAVFSVYFLVGTKKEEGFITRKINNKNLRWIVFLIVIFIIPSAYELIIGFIFHRIFGKMLWSYASYPFNLFGYICLGISLIWGILLFLFMNYIFDFIKSLVSKMPKATTFALALFLASITLIDVISLLIA
jgi:uncharacterized membrane protein